MKNLGGMVNDNRHFFDFIVILCLEFVLFYVDFDRVYFIYLQYLFTLFIYIIIYLLHRLFTSPFICTIYLHNLFTVFLFTSSIFTSYIYLLFCIFSAESKWKWKRHQGRARAPSAGREGPSGQARPGRDRLRNPEK